MARSRRSLSLLKSLHIYKKSFKYWLLKVLRGIAMSKLRDYIEVFKYKQTLMALVVGALSYLGALKTYDLPLNVATFLKTLTAILLITSGATGVNMVLDADIDALMPRTASRPIPAGRLSKSEVLRVSLVLLALGILISFLI
jgi:protoheme IX farnesyltransferase